MHGNRKESAASSNGNARCLRAFAFCRVIPLVALLVCVVTTSGCRSLRPSDREGLFARPDLLSTDKIRGPLERALHNEEDALTRGEKFSAAGQREVAVARKAFDEGKYPEAVKRYKKIADKYAESSIGEEAWFRLGESYYAMQEYPKAQDAYSKLFADYPSTKYVADASRRMFSIAKIWLEVSDPASTSQIKTVSQQVEMDPGDSAKTSASPGDPSVRYGLIPNFFDKTRPLIDTSGRAREALKSIWLNDPTGPLADDALMLTASYHLRRGDYIEADRYFEILRDEYPDSPHLEKAFVLGAHVKQMSYQGPMYDGTALVSAENLKERTLSLFPNSEDRQQVKQDLNKLYQEKAKRAWSRVEIYERKDNPRSVAIHCMQVITEFPDTTYAARARQKIRQIDPKLIRDLPGMSEFLESLPSLSVGPPAPQSSSDEPPVKSVSSPSGNKSPFRFPGF